MLGLKACTKCFGRTKRACCGTGDADDADAPEDDGAVVIVNSSKKAKAGRSSKKAKTGRSTRKEYARAAVDDDEW